MSIADKLTRLATAKNNIASAITSKGGTVNTGDGYEDFAADIATIPQSSTPTGSLTITDNGTYNVSSLAEVVVSVSGGGDAPEIAWGRVVPVDDSLTIDTGITDTNDIQLVFMAENDPRTAYAVLSFMTNISAFHARSYNGTLTQSDNLWGHFTNNWDNGVFTMTRMSGHNFRLSSNAYYWYAVPLSSNTVMFTMP